MHSKRGQPAAALQAVHLIKLMLLAASRIAVLITLMLMSQRLRLLAVACPRRPLPALRRRLY